MAFIVLNPESEEIAEGDGVGHSLCLSINNSQVDVDVFVPDGDLIQLAGGWSYCDEQHKPTYSCLNCTVSIWQFDFFEIFNATCYSCARLPN